MNAEVLEVLGILAIAGSVLANVVLITALIVVNLRIRKQKKEE